MNSQGNGAHQGCMGPTLTASLQPGVQEVSCLSGSKLQRQADAFQVHPQSDLAKVSNT